MLKALQKSAETKTISWCGPSALSIVTGCTYEEALFLLKKVTGRTIIRGVSTYNLMQAFNRLGYRTLWVRIDDRPSLAQWMRRREPRERKLACVVVVTGHYVVVKGNKAVDNVTKVPVNTSDMRKRRAVVREVIRTSKMEGARHKLTALRHEMRREAKKKSKARTGRLTTLEGMLSMMLG